MSPCALPASLLLNVPLKVDIIIILLLASLSDSDKAGEKCFSYNRELLCLSLAVDFIRCEEFKTSFGSSTSWTKKKKKN